MGLSARGYGDKAVGRMMFEAFMVFYLLECLVLLSVAVWYYREPKIKSKKIWNPWGEVWNEKEMTNGCGRAD